MHLRQHLAAKPTPRPQMRISGVLTQTMRLLSLPVDDLLAELNATLGQNPVVEIQPARRCPTCGRTLPTEGPCPYCTALPQDGEPIAFLVDPEDFNSPRPPSNWDGEERADFQEWVAEQVTLAEYVLRQIAPELAPEERPVAAYILTHLDEHGLLSEAPAQVALATRSSLRRVRHVLEIIQQADPPGVGAATPEEAMLAQVRRLREEQEPVPQGVEDALRLGLAWLRPTRLDALARRLQISPAAARRILNFVRDNLTPHPAQLAWGDIHQGKAAPLPTYTRPDIVFSLPEGDAQASLVVEVLAPGLRWRLNRSLSRQVRQGSADREAWEREIQQAEILLKSLRQRHHTLLRLATLLAREQRAFILQGPRHLRPMTRAAVARQLQVHESTVSRAVNGKTALLPNGRLIPLERFFDRSLPAREALKAIVAAEPRPLSDAQLARLLSREMGYPIARRTVTKYRALEGIPPAYLRKHEGRS